MTLMQLIKTVLDDLYGRIHIQVEQDKDDLIRAEIDTISMEYGQLTRPNTKPINYSDPIKRFAYLYKYTVAHADYIMQGIQESDELCALFRRTEVDVSCLGGGPGSDLLGILKYIMASECSPTLTCYIFDKERAWGDSWSRVARRMNATCRLHPVFQQMDVTDSHTWSCYEEYLQADLFTLSYFMSEVWKFKTNAEPFFNHTLSRSKPGALVLFIDNNDSRFHGWFDYLSTQNNFETIKAGSQNFAFSNDEEKRDLGCYFY